MKPLREHMPRTALQAPLVHFLRSCSYCRGTARPWSRTGIGGGRRQGHPEAGQRSHHGTSEGRRAPADNRCGHALSGSALRSLRPWALQGRRPSCLGGNGAGGSEDRAGAPHCARSMRHSFGNMRSRSDIESRATALDPRSFREQALSTIARRPADALDTNSGREHALSNRFPVESRCSRLETASRANSLDL